MQSYAGFVIFVLVIGFLIYLIASQGNLADIFTFSFNRSTSTPPAETPPPSPPPPRVIQPSPSPSPPTVTPPSGFTVEQLSPYYQQIRISSVSLGSFFGGLSYINISAYGAKEPVNVTDWRINSNDGIVLEIPEAINDYNPRRSLIEGPIFLNPGDSLYLYNSKNSANFNLRLNKCTGYLNNVYDLEPDLPRSCPGIDRNDITTFSGRCQSFILSFGSCREPTATEINSFAGEAVCREFLDTLSYRGCYERHRGDADFFSREWRAWLGGDFRTSNLDKEHDRLLLFDKNGLLVDIYVY